MGSVQGKLSSSWSRAQRARVVAWGAYHVDPQVGTVEHRIARVDVQAIRLAEGGAV